MKNIIIILIILIAISCKAQTPIIDLQERNGSRLENAYYKDTNNILNPFEGTWLYTNGNTSLKIVLVKKEMKLLATYYEDLIIGEYQYIENGVEKFNSLSDLNTIYPNEYKHNIVGNHIHTRPSPFDEFIAGEIILKTMFSDNVGGSIYLRRKMVGSQIAIQVYRSASLPMRTVYETDPVPIVPNDIYTLIKQ